MCFAQTLFAECFDILYLTVPHKHLTGQAMLRLLYAYTYRDTERLGSLLQDTQLPGLKTRSSDSNARLRPLL